MEDVMLYCGADAQNVQGRRLNLVGRRCFSGSYGPKSRFTAAEVPHVQGLLDSGAFSDAPEDRLCAPGALQRQLRWEREAERFWGCPWQAEAFVSYDLLIDEKWSGGKRTKKRWSVTEADRAVRVTVDAAEFLASQRQRLAPRQLVLATQGVDARQYEDCVRGVLAHADPADWLGLGGWCILGRQTSWLPTFWASMRAVLPLIRGAGLHRVHLFGVMYEPALGGLLWLCDQHELLLSTDSAKPVLATTWKNTKKAGAMADTWEENVRLSRHRLATLRSSRHYREPPLGCRERQLTLFCGEVA
jgi:hypothetical protein